MATATEARDDLYRVLGLEPRATRDQVERAYRFSLELYGEGSLATYSLVEPAEAEHHRQRIREAYETLADEGRRRSYDDRHGFLPPECPEARLASSSVEDAEGELPPVLTGKDLRLLREARGVSLRHVAAVSKIGVRFLEYIEGDRFEFLPAPVYLRGFLLEYGRVVGLDPGKVAEAYMGRLPGRR